MCCSRVQPISCSACGWRGASWRLRPRSPSNRYDLLILDNIAYVTRDQAETSVLFELIGVHPKIGSFVPTPLLQWQPSSGRHASLCRRARQTFPPKPLPPPREHRRRAVHGVVPRRPKFRRKPSKVSHLQILAERRELSPQSRALDRKRGRGRPPAHTTPKGSRKQVIDAGEPPRPASRRRLRLAPIDPARSGRSGNRKPPLRRSARANDRGATSSSEFLPGEVDSTNLIGV